MGRVAVLLFIKGTKGSRFMSELAILSWILWECGKGVHYLAYSLSYVKYKVDAYLIIYNKALLGPRGC